jgi:folate-binding protein YgfZ
LSTGLGAAPSRQWVRTEQPRGDPISDDSLSEIQSRRGAVFADPGAASPKALHFGDPREEYFAARDSAALFDVSDRTQIELLGADRAKFLHNFCTNNVKALNPGQGCEAFITNVKGRVLGHVFAFAAPDSIWLDSVPGAEGALVAHLDRYVITEDVVVRGRSGEFGEVFVSGPASPKSLAQLRVETAELSNLDHAKTSAFDFPCFVRRADVLGAPGFLLSAHREDLGTLWERIAGAGVHPAGAQEFEALRIEAGFPIYEVDISDDNIAQEAGRTRQAISFTKGCYLGQEPIARLDALGHTNRELRGLRLADGSIPERGAPVTAADGAQEIGRVTSSALSYADGCGVALAYLRRPFLERGANVHVHVSGREVPAAVYWPEADG